MYRYNYKVGFVGRTPPLSGGPIKWTEDKLLDWSTGIVFAKDIAVKNKLAIPGLRTRQLKSSATHKYHVGGPYNGVKLQVWTKIGTSKASKRLVRLLDDIYTVPPYSGRYEYSEETDQYIWCT